MFAIGWNADYLLLMTSVDGVIDQNGKVIPFYREDTTNMAIAKNASSRWGSGGITSKIRAARAAAAAGIQTSICNGKKLENIAQFVLTGQTGTVFERVGPIKAKKAWIGFLSKPKGSIFINEGAKIAIENNRSLLPVGVVHIEGDFQAGDVVEIRLDDGTFLGKGIINFSSAEAKKIVGLKSDQLEDVLGYDCSKVLIHIDNLWKRDN
jgi:glutamate 5-kinase